MFFEDYLFLMHAYYKGGDTNNEIDEDFDMWKTDLSDDDFIKFANVFAKVSFKEGFKKGRRVKKNDNSN